MNSYMNPNMMGGMRAPDFTLGARGGFQPAAPAASGMPQQAMLNMLAQQAAAQAKMVQAQNPPMPPARPAFPPQGQPGAPMQLASAAEPTLFERLRSMPNYQSNGMPTVMQPQGPTPNGAPMGQQINWGDPNSAADFFRADRAMMMQPGLLGFGG